MGPGGVFSGMNQEIVDFAKKFNENPVSSELAKIAEMPGAGMIIPGMGYVSLPQRLSILRESPFFKQALNMPGPGSSNIRQVMAEMNQGQNMTQSLRSLAEMLGVDKSKLIQLLGANAGR